MSIIKALFIPAVIAFAANANAQTYTYDFATGYDDWSGDFADYPVNDPEEEIN